MNHFRFFENLKPISKRVNLIKSTFRSVAIDADQWLKKAFQSFVSEKLSFQNYLKIIDFFQKRIERMLHNGKIKKVVK